MKLLLTSAGITNPSLHAALVGLLDKPIAECDALCISTGSYAMRGGGAMAWQFVTGNEPRTPMVELGWRSVGLLELTALPSIDREAWVPSVEAADVILVNGGDPMYLAHWMRESGFASLLPSFGGVYAGLSAGSMVLAPRIGEWFVNWVPPVGERDETLGVVDFALFPHLDHPDLPYNTMAHAERWAATMPVPSYALDDQSGISWVDGRMEVISEGHWRHFER